MRCQLLVKTSQGPFRDVGALKKPEPRPRFIEYVDDGSGWDKAWSKGRKDGTVRALGGIQDFATC